MATEIAAGVDIGGTNTVYGLVDRNGRVLSEENFPTTSFPKVEDFVATLSASVSKLVANESNIELKGIGIGAPNANYHKGTIELAPNLAWKEISK